MVHMGDKTRNAPKSQIVVEHSSVLASALGRSELVRGPDICNQHLKCTRELIGS